MEGIKNILDNPIVRDDHQRQRNNILKKFPELLKSPHNHILSHKKYLLSSPQKYFSHKVYSNFLIWLNERDQIQANYLQSYFKEYSNNINRAILHLEEINNYDWHDHFECIDEYDHIIFIDQHINPSLLRLTEAVLAPLLHIIAVFSRIDRNKDSNELDVWNIIEEVKKYSSMSCATNVYYHLIRNAIAHGGIEYVQGTIVYKDKKRNKEKFEDTEIIRKFDDLVDTCNALSAALSVFLISHQINGYLLPQRFLLEELRAETLIPWWEIVGCMPSMHESINQLMIYSRPHTSDVNKVQLASFQSGVLAEFFAPGYERYFFSIKSSKSWQGFASFNGNKLKSLREKDKTLLIDYSGIMDNFFFYVPGMRFQRIFSKFETLYYIFKIIMSHKMEDFRNKLNWPKIVVRDAKIHRNAWGCVLNGSVYLDFHEDEIDQMVIKEFRRNIIRKTLKYAKISESYFSLLRYLPLGFARISLFQKDYRRRRLINFGLGVDLIGTIQFQRIKRIKNPDILGSKIEQIGKYRFAWNKAWLNKERSDKNI